MTILRQKNYNYVQPLGANYTDHNINDTISQGKKTLKQVSPTYRHYKMAKKVMNRDNYR